MENRRFIYWIRGGMIVASIQVVIALSLWLYPDTLDVPWLAGTLEFAAFLVFGFPGGIPVIAVVGTHGIDTSAIVVAAILNWLFWTPIVTYAVRSRRNQTAK